MPYIDINFIYWYNGKTNFYLAALNWNLMFIKTEFGVLTFSVWINTRRKMWFIYHDNNSFVHKVPIQKEYFLKFDFIWHFIFCIYWCLQ